MEDIKDKYADIINLDHHVSKVRKQMSIYKRSAQFAPFAALTGYGDAVKETARLTNEKIELSDEQKYNISNTLNIINDDIKSKPLVNITYYIKDSKKLGGKYDTLTDNVKKIDSVYKIIYLTKDKIYIEDILDIEIIN